MSISLESKRYYPDIEDLKPTCPYEFPKDLWDYLEIRYKEGAEKYRTEYSIFDRPLNSCMMKNSLVDIVEEVTDAIFNTLVAVLKNPELAKNGQSPLPSMLASLVYVWQRGVDLLENDPQQGLWPQENIDRVS